MHNITYHWDDVVITSGSDTTVKSKILDNRHSLNPIVFLIDIDETNTKSISESYSFGGSKTSEIGASLEVSATSKFGVPAVGIKS